MDGVFGEAARLKQLRCLLKEAGHQQAPSFLQAVACVEKNGDTLLEQWINEQDQRMLEDLLRLHWQDP